MRNERTLNLARKLAIQADLNNLDNLRGTPAWDPEKELEFLMGDMNGIAFEEEKDTKPIKDLARRRVRLIGLRKK